MHKKIIILLLMILISAGMGYAEDGKSEVWQPTTPGPFVTYTAPVCKKGQLDIQPLYFFNIARGIFYDNNYDSLPSKDYIYQELLQLYMQYGLMERVEICIQPTWQWNYARIGSDSASSNGMGDMLLIGRYCLIEETKWLPMATGMFQVKLPTGKYQKSDNQLLTDITGTGSTDYTYGVSFTKGVKPINTVFHLDLLYTDIPSPVRIDGIKTEYTGIYIINSALEWIFYKNFNLLGELLWQSQGDLTLDGGKVLSSNKNFLIFSTGIGYSKKDWQILLGYQRTLIGNNVNANDTVAGTINISF